MLHNHLLETVAAMALIMAPVDDLYDCQPDQSMEIFFVPTVRLASELEILDAGECRYIFYVSGSYSFIRARYRKYDSMPMSKDRSRFPPGRYVENGKNLNWNYLLFLEAKQSLELFRQEQLNPVITETKRLYQVWGTLTYDHGDICATSMREKLNDLRRLIGDKAYYEGRLPLPVPIWSFQPLD